ncbi:phosphopantetheine-binding protein [Streptomyces stramineus]
MTNHLNHTHHTRLNRTGLHPMTTPEALTLYDTATTHTHHPTLLPAHLTTHHTPTPPLLQNLTTTTHHHTPTTSAASPTLRAQLSAMDSREQQRLVLDTVRSQVALVLGHGTAESVQSHQAFRDLGFDSLTAVELRNRLTAVTGLRLPSSLVFDHPTPEAVAQYLRQDLQGTHDEDSPRHPSAAGTVTAEPIAIVGMACRYPGGIRSPQALWDLVAAWRRPPLSRRIAVGTWRGCSTRTRTTRALATPGTAASFTTRVISTPNSSGSAHEKR